MGEVKVTILIDDILKKQSRSRYWLIKNTGLTFKTITALCNNEAKAVHFETLGRICKVLNCKLDDIVTFE